MAVPNATITKNIALASDGWRRTAYPDGSLPNAGPSAPPEFTTSKTSSSITATITAANGATSFRVRVNSGTAEDGLTKTGLSAETPYSFQVQGYNAYGESDWSDPVSVTTNAAGALVNGAEITISGSNFEAIADPRPTAYDNFNEYSGLTSGDLIPAGISERWLNNGGPFHSPYELTTELVMSGRNYAAKSTGAKAELKDPVPLSGRAAFGFGAHYLTYLWAANENLLTPPQPSEIRSDKWHRCADDPSGDFTRISFEPAQGGPTDGRLATYQHGDGTQDPFRYPLMGNAESTPNTFHRIEQWIVGGQIWLSCNGRINGPYAITYDSGGGSAPMRLTVLGHDVSQPSKVNSTLRNYLAEVYEQATPARVELSNASTWQTSEHRRFLQVTKTRSDTQLSFELFKGDLDDQAPLYAYIIKSDGSVNTSGILVDGDTINAGDWSAL